MDLDDLDAFVLRLTDPAVYHAQYGCETCPLNDEGGGDGGGCLEADPAAVAAAFAAELAPERVPAFLDLVVAFIAAHDDERGAFWSEVLAAFE